MFYQKKTLNNQSIEISIIKEVEAKVRNFYHDNYNLKIKIDERNSAHNMQVIHNGIIRAFFQIQKKKERLFRIWCYPYMPFDMEYSCNGFIECTTFQINTFSVYDIGMDESMEFERTNLNFHQLCSALSTKIINLTEAQYEC